MLKVRVEVTDGLLSALALGDLQHDQPNAEDPVVTGNHRVVAGEPIPLAARLARRFAADLQIERGFAGGHDLTEEGRDGGSKLGQDLLNTTADMVRGSHAVDLGESLIDLPVAQVLIKE